MTWTFILVLILAALIKIILTCLPTSVVEWMISKFELHPKLNDADVTVFLHNKSLLDEEKKQIIAQFNEALFLERYYYVPSEENETSIVLQTTKGKINVRYFIYCYSDHVDVIKRYKKKEIAYRIRSNFLQEFHQMR